MAGAPHLFGDYEFLDEIARGGMGVVYRARQVSLNRVVALKMILTGNLAGEAEVKRFRSEAESAASLDHPNIVPIYEVGEHEGQHFFSMRLIEGRSLADALDSFRNDPRASARLMATVARAVHFAHQRGILHRDLKPGNILLDVEGQPHVTDFGLAKRVGSDSNLTLSGAVLGTPSYMAPEQALGKTGQLTTAADIHSLGAILYHLLTGTAPFDSGSPFETLRRLVEQEPTRPSLLQKTIDRDLETICLKCLEKSPSRRYGSAEALADDLDRWLAHEPIQARRSSAVWWVAKWVQRKPALAAAVALLHLVAGGGLAAVLVQWHRAQDAEIEALDQLRESYLAQAQARRFSGRPGRRFASLDVLAKAAALRPSLALRNEAIACMPLVDLRLERRWKFGLNQQKFTFDEAAERYSLAEGRGEVSVRRFEDDRVLARLPAPSGVSSLPDTRFSPDGRLVRLTYNGVFNHVWELDGPRRVLSAVGDGAEFSPDSRLLVVPEREGGLSLYDLGSAQKLRTLGGTERLMWPSFDPGMTRLSAVTARDREALVILDAASGVELARLPHSRAIHRHAWHPAGHSLVSCENDSSAILVWDARTWTVSRRLEDVRSAPVSLAFCHDGSLLAAGGWDGQVRVWDFEPGRQLLSAPGGGFVQFGAKTRRLAVTSWARDAAWCFEVAPGREITVFHEQRAPSSGGERVHFSRDGALLTYSMGQQLKVRDPASGREIAAVTEQPVHHFLPDPVNSGFWVATAEGWFRWPAILDAGGKPVRLGEPEKLQAPANYRLAGISADGSVVLGHHGQDHCHFLDGRTFAQIARMKTNQAGMRFHSLSPNGRWAATGAWHNPTVNIWDARTGDLLRTLRMDDMCSVAFSPDSRWLVVGGTDFQFLEAGSWTLRRRLERPFLERFPPAMAFSRNGRILALCHSWQTVKLVLTETGEELATLESPGGWNINSLSFNADASLLAVAGGVSEIHVWNLGLIREQLARMKLDWDDSGASPRVR